MTQDVIIEQTRGVSEIATRSLHEIEDVAQATRMLGINALIESAHAGTAGKGFAVVAGEVTALSKRIAAITGALSRDLTARLAELDRTNQQVMSEVRGQRLADLSLGMIEIMDRNLYERSCDVRWWATDAAVVDAATHCTDDARRAHASRRLGVILDAYTVYLDIWVCDLQGNVIATGRPGRFPMTVRHNVANEAWFRDALQTRSGGDFAVADITTAAPLDNRLVATYSAAIRADGATNGAVIGVLGIFFDWQTQAQAVVNGVRLTEAERARTRCMLVDRRGRVIAASDGRGILLETLPVMRFAGKVSGHYQEMGRAIGFALTPGYETYQGLGWYGVIEQQVGPAVAQAA
jgi:hypothetical protein